MWKNFFDLLTKLRERIRFKLTLKNFIFNISYRDIGISVRPHDRMYHTLKHQRTRYDWDVLEHLLAHFFLRLHMLVVAAIHARSHHPLEFVHLRCLLAYKIRKHPHRYMSTIFFPVPFFEYLKLKNRTITINNVH